MDLLESTNEQKISKVIAIMGWLYFALFYDGIILYLLLQFSDYPIEKAMIVVTAFSLVDLPRIQILLHLDVSAMMGYTGAIFKDFFGSFLGLLLSFSLLCLWIIIPFFILLIKFKNKDL